MKNTSLLATLAAGLVTLGGCISQQGTDAKRPMALVIMLDGLRADALETADAPNITRLRTGTWQPGYHGLWSLTGHTVPDANPSSAPNHVAIATGVTAAKHGVKWNGTTSKGHFTQWPTWLTRIADANPKAKALFAFSWGEDKDVGPTSRVRFLRQSDAANAASLATLMAAPDAPDATLYYIDVCDGAGHSSNFYPYSGNYLHAVHQVDAYIGAILNAIAARPTFAEEDWLIAVTSDHGGYLNAHGMWGGHATTIPVVLASRHIESGRIPGVPWNFDVAATALNHFGIDVTPLGLDAKVLGKAAPATPPHPLKDGLAAYLPFDGDLSNQIANGPVVKSFGPAKRFPKAFLGSGLHLEGGTNAACGVRLEGSEKILPGPNGTFAITLWARLPQAQMGDPVLFGNKDWSHGVNPGFALTAGKPTPNFKTPGLTFNCKTLGVGNRLDLGAYHPTPNAWTFYAVVRSAEGIVTFYHGSAEGQLYWISDNGGNMVSASALPLCLGQDGTGNYPFNLAGDLDEFALWTRELEPKDVRRLYEAGRRGLGLKDLLNADR